MSTEGRRKVENSPSGTLEYGVDVSSLQDIIGTIFLGNGVAFVVQENTFIWGRCLLEYLIIKGHDDYN